MSAPLVWLHEEALRLTHPVFKAAPAGIRTVYVWDDAYFKTAGYTLKRLIFIYETLCELPVDIIHADTRGTIAELAPSTLYLPATNNPLLVAVIDSFRAIAPLKIVADEPFAVIKKPTEFRRFFQYWNKAEKTAFLTDGGVDAAGN